MSLDLCLETAATGRVSQWQWPSACKLPQGLTVTSSGGPGRGAGWSNASSRGRGSLKGFMLLFKSANFPERWKRGLRTMALLSSCWNQLGVVLQQGTSGSGSDSVKGWLPAPHAFLLHVGLWAHADPMQCG